MVLVVRNPPTNAGDKRDAGLILGLGRPLGVGNANQLQYSCLKNPMDREAWKAMVHAMLCYAKSLQSCPTLWNPMGYSLPGFSVHGILQARILEWVAKPFSRGSSQPRNQTWGSCVSCMGLSHGLFTTSTWEAQYMITSDEYGTFLKALFYS